MSSNKNVKIVYNYEPREVRKMSIGNLKIHAMALNGSYIYQLPAHKVYDFTVKPDIDYTHYFDHWVDEAYVLFAGGGGGGQTGSGSSGWSGRGGGLPEIRITKFNLNRLPSENNKPGIRIRLGSPGEPGKNSDYSKGKAGNPTYVTGVGYIQSSTIIAKGGVGGGDEGSADYGEELSTTSVSFKNQGVVHDIHKYYPDSLSVPNTKGGKYGKGGYFGSRTVGAPGSPGWVRVFSFRNGSAGSLPPVYSLE